MISAESVLDFAAVFWARVDRSAGSDKCWPWTGTLRDGYGAISVGRRKLAAHRVAFALSNGGTCAGGVVRHRCDNPPCCNPAHLLGGTQFDNIRDRVERDRGARGARNGRALINDSIATEMVAQLAAGLSCAAVASLHGVKPSLVDEIRRGHNWRHIPRPAGLPPVLQGLVPRKNPRRLPANHEPTNQETICVSPYLNP